MRYSAAKLWPWGTGTGMRGWRAEQGCAREQPPASQEGSARWLRGSAKGWTGCYPRVCGAR